MFGRKKLKAEIAELKQKLESKNNVMLKQRGALEELSRVNARLNSTLLDCIEDIVSGAGRLYTIDSLIMGLAWGASEKSDSEAIYIPRSPGHKLNCRKLYRYTELEGVDLNPMTFFKCPDTRTIMLLMKLNLTVLPLIRFAEARKYRGTDIRVGKVVRMLNYTDFESFKSAELGAGKSLSFSKFCKANFGLPVTELFALFHKYEDILNGY